MTKYQELIELTEKLKEKKQLKEIKHTNGKKYESNKDTTTMYNIIPF